MDMIQNIRQLTRRTVVLLALPRSSPSWRELFVARARAPQVVIVACGEVGAAEKPSALADPTRERFRADVDKLLAGETEKARGDGPGKPNGSGWASQLF